MKSNSTNYRQKEENDEKKGEFCPEYISSFTDCTMKLNQSTQKQPTRNHNGKNPESQ